MHDHDNGRDPTTTELRRWNAVDELDEAALENELVGNNLGAGVTSDPPDEPIFNQWLAEFSSLLPSYVEVVWSQRDNDRKVGFRRGSNRRMISLPTTIGDSFDNGLVDYTIESAVDFALTPQEAVSRLRETFPNALEI